MTDRHVTRRGFLACSMMAVAWPAWAEGIPTLVASRTFEMPVDRQVQEPSVITAVAISPDGHLVAGAGDDHLVHVWDLSDGRRLQSLRGHLDWIRSLSFNAEGTRLASAGDDRRLLVWEIATGRQALSLGGNDRALYCVRYSPDGRTLAAVGFDQQLKLYEAATGDLSTVLACPGADMRAVTFSPDGLLMATSGRSGQVRVWDMGVMNVAFDRDTHDRRVRALAFSSDGAQLAVAGEAPHIMILNSRTGEPITTIANPAGRVMSLAYVGPQNLATGSSDNTIQIWDVTTGREERRLTGHHGSVSALAFEPRSGVLVSGSFDTTLRIWQLGGDGQRTTQKPVRTNSRY